MTRKTRSTNNLPYCQTRSRTSETSGLASSSVPPSCPSFASKRLWTLCTLLLTLSLIVLQPSLCQCSMPATPNAQSLQRHNHHHHHHHQHHQQQRQHVGEQDHTDVDSIDSLNETPQIEKPLNSNADTQDKMPLCPNCFLSERNFRNDKSSNDALRLEAIKYQILSKLGLKSKPNVTSPVPREVILETLYRAEGTSNVAGLGLLERERERDRESESEEEETIAGTYGGTHGGTHGGTSSRPVTEGEQDDYFGRTSEIIAFAEPGHTLNGQPLLEFAHTHDDAGGTGSELRVKGASLWVHVHFRTTLPRAFHNLIPPRNLTLWVFRILHSNTTQLSGKEFDEHTEMAASLPVTLSNLGWQKFDLTATVREWYTTSDTFPRQRLRLLVDCSGCSELVEAVLFRDPIAGDSTEKMLVKDPQRPFLVIHTDPSQTKRVRRRALDCSGALKGQCCKQRFYVSFKRLGWEDWIIAPGGYYANYCRGDCGGIHRTPDTFHNYYTHVMEGFRKMDRLTGMQSCCAPLKFSSMSLIYFGPDSNIIKRDLPKMVVDECGCP